MGNDCKCKCNKEACELCSNIHANPVDMDRHGTKLVTVRVKIKDVCLGKKVAVACIIYDHCHRILAFKGFVTMACKENEYCQDECGIIERKIVFVIPEDDMCNPDKLNVHTIANYIYPCEDK